MTDDADPRDELRSAIDGLSDNQARTMLNWARTVAEQRGRLAQQGRTLTEAVAAGEPVLGTLGELLGIERESIEPGRVRMSLTVDPTWHNPNGVLHGGVIYTMVDYCMGAAVHTGLAEGQTCATIELKVNYLATVREGKLTVETNVVKLGRNIAFTESKVADENGRLVATASGSMFVIQPIS